MFSSVTIDRRSLRTSSIQSPICYQYYGNVTLVPVRLAGQADTSIVKRGNKKKKLRRKCKMCLCAFFGAFDEMITD